MSGLAARRCCRQGFETSRRRSRKPTKASGLAARILKLVPLPLAHDDAGGTVGHGSDRNRHQHPRPEARRPLAHVPAIELEDPAHRVLVEPLQMRHRPVAKPGFSSIMALIGVTKRSCSGEAAFTGP